MDDFRKEVIKELEKKLGDGYEIFPHDRTKNNMGVLHGVCIHNKSEDISPVVYLEEYILPYAAGIMSLEKIAGELLKKCRMDEVPRNMADHVDDFGMMKEKVRIKVINYGANTEKLKQIPHRKFLDLAIAYYLDMDIELEGGKVTIGITNSLMEKWNVSEEELYCLGMEKLLAEDDCQVTELLSLLRQNAENELEERVIAEFQKDRNRPEMYIATNRRCHYGAGCLLNTALLKDVAENTGCSLMLYPVSVHEIIIIPQKNGSERCLDIRDIREINRTCIPREECLSNSIYLYDRTKQEISIYKEGEPL